jgi:phosphoribosylformylglycinamidine synthase
MKKAKVLVVRAPGTNCDLETADAFSHLGAHAEVAHVNLLTSGAVKAGDFDILAFPGGFAHGDYIAAGKIFTAELSKIRVQLEMFIKSGRPVIGICNGFQVLVKTGFIPSGADMKQHAGFTFNDNGRFTAKWVKLKVNKQSNCLFTKGLPDEIELPIAHGEGKFVTDSPETLAAIRAGNCAAITYADNPNGSQDDIAALCNKEGNCLGIMPHPERYAFPFQHPAWQRRGARADGMELLRNAVKYVN